VAGVRQEDGPGGLPFLIVDTERCQARLSLYGAHLCGWTPAGQTTSAIFLSPRATFTPGKAIRGGVPVCFPWFANHPTDRTKPAHGFARTRTWELGETTRADDGDVRVTLHLASDAETHQFWPADFTASLSFTLGTSLGMTFECENTGRSELTYEIALHTYLAVGNVEQAHIGGLERTRFIDKVDGGKQKMSGAEPLIPRGDVDRVFLDTAAPCTVDDPVLGRRITVTKRGSPSTVVWNPGRDKGLAIADLGEAWQRFVCVESANCAPHAVRLKPRARHAMTATLEVEPLT
jgi:D-hexose-6-phosphate mutarotase